MTRIADTSAIYAFFDVDDEHHNSAVKAFENAEPILVPREILVETTDLIAFRSERGHAKKCLESLLGFPHVAEADRVPLQGVLQVHDRSKRLSLADAVVVQTCLVQGAAALTFDKEIARMVKAH